MPTAHAEILIAVLDRLKAIEKQQRADATLLLNLYRAYSGARPENPAQLETWRGSAEATIAQRLPSDPSALYDELIARLKAGE
jgi:hypothetical protein